MNEFFSEVIDDKLVENLFNLQLNSKCKKLIKDLDLRYRYLSREEEDNHIIEIIKFLRRDIVPSGDSRKPAWNNGWEENLNDFTRCDYDIEQLIPHYYRRGRSIMRLEGKFIMPESKLFEANFLKIVQLILCEKYLSQYKFIYEFGAGPCHNIVAFAQNMKDKNFYITDWVLPSISIAELLEKNKTKLNFPSNTFKGSIFNLFNPDYNLTLEEGSIVLTFGSLEQIGDRFESVLDYFLSHKNVNFLHIEPNLEGYKTGNLFDQFALQYSQKRGYLEGYYAKLNELSLKGIIKITSSRKIIGSGFHDGWTIVAWNKSQ